MILVITSSAEAAHKDAWQNLLAKAFKDWAALSNASVRLRILDERYRQLGLPLDQKKRYDAFQEWQSVGADEVNAKIKARQGKHPEAKTQLWKKLWLGFGMLALSAAVTFYWFANPPKPQIEAALALRDQGFYQDYREIVEGFKELAIINQDLKPILYIPVWQGRVSERYLAFLSGYIEQQVTRLADQLQFIDSINNKFGDQDIYHERAFVEIFGPVEAHHMQRSSVFFQTNLGSRRKSGQAILRNLQQLQRLISQPAQCRMIFLVSQSSEIASDETGNSTIEVHSNGQEFGRATAVENVAFDNLGTILDAGGVLSEISVADELRGGPRF